MPKIDKVSFSVKVLPSLKTYLRKTMNEIPDKFPDISDKDDAIERIFDIYNEKIQPRKDYAFLDSEVQRALNIISCTYLKYEGDANGFMCNEFIYRKKKGDPIGFDPEHVIIRCKDCRQGKEEQKELAIEKLLQKDSIKKIFDLRKTLLTMVGKGFDAEAFICKGDFFEQDAAYFSKDGLHLPCPLIAEENLALVSIQDVCKETINPDTLRAPCQHLINLYHRVFIKDIEDIIKEAESGLPQIEQKAPAKVIEVESTVIDDSEITIPKVETPEETPEEPTEE